MRIATVFKEIEHLSQCWPRSKKITNAEVMNIAQSTRSRQHHNFFLEAAINLFCSEVDKNQMLGSVTLRQYQETGLGLLPVFFLLGT
jgi:hypothetical protein